MTTDQSRPTDEDNATDFGRREFVAAGVGVGATLLAGCTGDAGISPAGGSEDGEAAGRFRLLISDQPADIGDFDSLTVTLDSARIFEAGDDEDEDANETDSEEDDEEVDEPDDDEANETDGEDADEEEVNEPDDEDEDEDEDEQEAEDEGDEDDDESEVTVIDLDGATVDLTQVIGQDAIAVFDGELSEGSYSKLELVTSNVEGVVDGDDVEVKLPSEKLQLTKPFEVTADEPVDFVFDINVVKRGPNNGYILKPVISESGVAGRDVEVNEIDEDEDEQEDDEQEGEGGQEEDEAEQEDEDEQEDEQGGAGEGDGAEGGNESGSQ